MADGVLRPGETATTEEWQRLLKGTPVYYGGKSRSTNEWLQFARRNPAKIAAWALRDVIDELVERRAEMHRDCQCPRPNPDCEHPTCPRWPYAHIDGQADG